MSSETSQSAPVILSIDDDEAEVPIPANLKFILEALKLLSHHPLTTENHLVWSSQVETIFYANGFAKHLNPHTPIPPKTLPNTACQPTTNPKYLLWNLINSNLIAALIATISPPLQNLVLRKPTVADVWTSLLSRLQSQSRSRIIQLKEELHSLNMKNDTMSHYLNHIKTISDQFAAADSPVDDEDLLIYIMNGLPSSYNGFKKALRLKTDRVDINTFYSLLLTEELNLVQQHRLELQQPNMALSASRARYTTSRPNTSRGRGRPPSSSAASPSSNSHGGRGRPTNSRPSTPKAPGVECQICLKIGHTAKHCWYRHHSSASSSNRAAFSSEIQPPYDEISTPGSSSNALDDWLLDSGASAHLTNQF